MKFRLQLFDGHIQLHNGEDDDGKILATKTILRTYLSPDVERHEVHVGRIRGTLFVPKQKAKFPGNHTFHPVIKIRQYEGNKKAIYEQHVDNV